MNKEFEEELRTIVNHPRRAFGSVHFGLSDAIQANSECVIMAMKVMAKGVAIIFTGGWMILEGLSLMARCILRIAWHIFVLAFYPGIKIYYILRVRRDLRRDHPEYIARE